MNLNVAMGADSVFESRGQWHVRMENLLMKRGIGGKLHVILPAERRIAVQSAWIRVSWNMDLSSNANPGSVGLSGSVLKNELCRGVLGAC